MSTHPLTRNVTAVFRTASDAHRESGMGWYADAYRVADALAVRYGVTPIVASGVIAALSPLNSWGANINLAGRFIAAGGLTEGYLGIGLRKAQRILDGAEPLTVLVSDKVANFYSSIVTAGETDAVCVDRHAYSISHATRTVDVPSMTHKRYESIADTYRRAARILTREAGTPVHAAQVQAVTWVSWRTRFWSEGAFDPKSA